MTDTPNRSRTVLSYCVRVSRVSCEVTGTPGEQGNRPVCGLWLPFPVFPEPGPVPLPPGSTTEPEPPEGPSTLPVQPIQSAVAPMTMRLVQTCNVGMGLTSSGGF